MVPVDITGGRIPVATEVQVQTTSASGMKIYMIDQSGLKLYPFIYIVLSRDPLVIRTQLGFELVHDELRL